MGRRLLRLPSSSDEEDEEQNLQTLTINRPNPNPNPNPPPSNPPLEISDDEDFADVADAFSPPSPPPPATALPTAGTLPAQPPSASPMDVADGEGVISPVDGFLRELGLRLRREWLESCLFGLSSYHSGFESLDVAAKAKLCFEQFLFSDMNYSGGGILPENVHGMHGVVLEGPLLLQVDEIVNISSHLRERYRDASAGLKRCLKLSLTDGVQCVFAMEYRPIRDLEVLAPAGQKIVIRNVHIQRGLLMLVPEVLEVLGGVVEGLDAARQRLVHEVNKPPRGRRKQSILTLSRRASLAAWPPPTTTNNAEQANILIPNAIDLAQPVPHATPTSRNDHHAGGYMEFAAPPSRSPTEEFAAPQTRRYTDEVAAPQTRRYAVEVAAPQTTRRPMEEFSVPHTRGPIEEVAAPQTRRHTEEITASQTRIPEEVAAPQTRIPEEVAAPQTRRPMEGFAIPCTSRSTTEDFIATQHGRSTFEDLSISHTERNVLNFPPCDRRSREEEFTASCSVRSTTKDLASSDTTGIHVEPSAIHDRGDAEPMTPSNTVTDVGDIHMVGETEHPLILTGEREIPFTYLASLLAILTAREECTSTIQGKIKCFLTGVKGFQFKHRRTFELRVYVDDGSLISEVLIDHNVVQKGIGHSPEEVTAALSSTDKATASGMRETMKRFQFFLAKFEGTMLVEMSRDQPIPVALEMNQGYSTSDSWLLLKRLKLFTASLEPQQQYMNPINISP